jgi:hypothetical protein
LQRPWKFQLAALVVVMVVVDASLLTAFAVENALFLVDA